MEPREIAVWLTHEQVPGWHFSAANAARLRAALPATRVQVYPDVSAFLAGLATAEAALVWRFEQAWLAEAPRLQWLATPAAGRDYFQLDPPPGLRLTYGTFHGELMAETVLGWLLGWSRGLFAAQTWQAAELWPRARLAGIMRPLRGARLTILGFGHIGEWVGRLAKPLGVILTGVRRRPGPQPDYFTAADRVLTIERLDEVLAETDFLVLALPGETGTDRLLDARRLDLLPRSAVVCNIGRGNAIDETALAAALRAGRLAGACLDVFAREPLPADSPLRGLPNALLLPHASAIAPNYLDLFVDEFVGLCRQA